MGNGYVEGFNARLRDELLDGEIFYTLREAQIVIESWRRHHNSVRPHAAQLSTPRRKSSCRHSPHGRLRIPDQLRLPLAPRPALKAEVSKKYCR
jgi:hypothetical protein